MRVPEDLHLDVPRRREVALEVDRVAAEGGAGAVGAGAEGLLQLGLGAGHGHADAAATAGRLHQHREADALGGLARATQVGHHAVAARDHRDPRARRPARGPGPCPSSAPSTRAAGRRRRCPPRCRRGRTRRSRRRSRSPGGRPRRRSPSPPRISASRFEVAVLRRRRAEAHRLVRLLHEGRLGVGVRVDGDGAQRPSSAPRVPMRRAISPRLAMSSERNMAASGGARCHGRPRRGKHQGGVVTRRMTWSRPAP